MRALGDKLLLSEEQVQLLFGDADMSSMGLQRKRISGYDIVGYETSSEGVHAAFDYYPKNGHSCVILGNTSDPELVFANDVRRWLCDYYFNDIAA